MDNSIDIDILDYQEHGICRENKKSRLTDSSPGRLVESLIRTNKVVIFSKSSCPHCKDSMSLLKDMGVEFTTVELDKIQEGSLVQNTLGQMTNARTVPRIFINGECVGGNSDLQQLGSSGKLKNLLYEDQESWGEEMETLKRMAMDNMEGYEKDESEKGTSTSLSQEGSSVDKENGPEKSLMEYVSTEMEGSGEVDASDEVDASVDEDALVEKFAETFEELSENNASSSESA